MSARDMRDAAWALFLLGTEHGGDPGTFDRDSAEIRASWDRVFEKAWIASPLRRPRADDDALVKERDEATRKWNAAVYDADKVRVERDRAEREWHAATARADKAEALLREARVGLDQCACCGWSELVARIDAALEEKK